MKEKYKNDEQSFLDAVDALHKERGLVPKKDLLLGFCPLIMQIFIAAGIYGALQHMPYGDGFSFFTITSLAAPDTSGLIVGLLILRFALGRVVNETKLKSKIGLFGLGTNAYSLLLRIAASYILPSGLSLYIVASSFTSFGLSLWIKRTERQKKSHTESFISAN